MNICSRYIIRVNNTTYSTDSVELIPIVIHLLGGAKAFGRCALRIIISHNATLGSCQLAYFDRLGVYHKDIFPTVYALGNIPADVFCKTSREFATDVELSSGYKVRDMFGRFSQSLKEVVLAVITECFGCKRKSYNFQIRKGGITPRRDTLPCSFTRFPANFLQMSLIFVNFSMKLCIRRFELNSLDAIKLLKTRNMHNLSFVILLTF